MIVGLFGTFDSDRDRMGQRSCERAQLLVFDLRSVGDLDDGHVPKVNSPHYRREMWAADRPRSTPADLGGPLSTITGGTWQLRRFLTDGKFRVVPDDAVVID